jgi:hypothetical protein
MDRACLVGTSLAVAAAAFTFIPNAHGVQGSVNGFGQGSARASIWSFPNQPPATPSFNVSNTQAPFINLGPGLPGADPRTQVHFQAGDNWRTTSQIRAATGDTVDWHSMLPHVTATSTDAQGTLDVIASQPLGGNARLFTVTWSASDPGVAMHIGWFENGSLIFQTPVMIGPFNRVDTFLVTATGQINLLEMEVSAAATSLVPAPGVLAVFAAGGLLAGRRRRRA